VAGAGVGRQPELDLRAGGGVNPVAGEQEALLWVALWVALWCLR
jgi:hypothetical protein